jgi:hypothetical protein
MPFRLKQAMDQEAPWCGDTVPGSA